MSVKQVKQIEYEIFDNFWNPSKFKKYTNYERSKGFFIINRRIAIKHPTVAAHLSLVGINTGQAINWLQKFMSSEYSSKPSWLFTKANKASTTKKEKTFSPNKDILKQYCKMNNCEEKDVYKAYEFFPKEIETEFKELEKLYKATE